MASERLRACVEKMDDEALAAVVCAVRRADGDDAAVQTRGSHVFVLFKGTDDSKGVAWICTEETPTTDRLEKFPALVDDLGADRGIVTNATGEPIDDVPDGVEYLDFDGIVDAIEAAGVTETVLATHGDISEDSAEAATAAKEVTDTGSDTPAPDDREQAQPETQQPPADERLPGSQSHEPPPQEERAETSQRQDGPQTDQHVRDDHPSPAQSQRGGQPRSQQPPQQGSHQPQGGQPQQAGHRQQEQPQQAGHRQQEQPQQAGHRQQEQPQQGIPGDGDRSPQAQQPQRGGEPATQPPGGNPPQSGPASSQPPPGQPREDQSQQGRPAGGGPPNAGPNRQPGQPGPAKERTGPSQAFDRLRRSALPLVVLVVVVGGAAAAGAWQLGLIGDSVDEPGGTNLAAPSDGTIPQTVDYVLAIDPAVTDDEVTRTLVETAVQPGGTPFDSVSSGLAQFQATTGIEPNRIEQAVVFGRMEQSRPAVAMELQLADQASPRSVAETVTPDSVEQTTYAGTTVYQAGKARPDGVEQWVTSPAEGVVIVGYAPAVKDALDVRNGDTAAWDGRLRERFESMGADPIRLATRLPAEQFGADGLGRADVLTASYGAAGSAVSVQSTVYTPDPETASAIANNVDGTIGPLTEDLRDSNQFSSGADALAQTTVQREGSTVRIEMAADPESVGTLTSVLLQTGGFLQTNPTVVTETNTPAPTADRIAVVNTVGSNIENESVGTVSMTVKLAPGSGPIDVTETTVQWVGSSGTYVLVADGVGGGDGQFTIEAIRDDDNSIQSSGTLNSPEDRAQLVFSPGDGFGARLDAGTQGQLTFTTESGTTTTATIVVPDSLAGKDAVAL